MLELIDGFDTGTGASVDVDHGNKLVGSNVVYHISDCWVLERSRCRGVITPPFLDGVHGLNQLGH
jgi:hypothetical protein